MNQILYHTGYETGKLQSVSTSFFYLMKTPCLQCIYSSSNFRKRVEGLMGRKEDGQVDTLGSTLVIKKSRRQSHLRMQLEELVESWFTLATKEHAHNANMQQHRRFSYHSDSTPKKLQKNSKKNIGVIYIMTPPK